VSVVRVHPPLPGEGSLAAALALRLPDRYHEETRRDGEEEV
jgi:hypothetical protein